MDVSQRKHRRLPVLDHLLRILALHRHIYTLRDAACDCPKPMSVSLGSAEAVCMEFELLTLTLRLNRMLYRSQAAVSVCCPISQSMAGRLPFVC